MTKREEKRGRKKERKAFFKFVLYKNLNIMRGKEG